MNARLGLPSNPASRPSHVPEDLWNRRIAENPEPERCSPVAVTGHAELKQRLDADHRQTEEHALAVESLAAQLGKIENGSERARARIARARARHATLSLKMLEAMRRLELVRCAGQPVFVEEREARRHLDALRRAADGPRTVLAELHTDVARAQAGGAGRGARRADALSALSPSDAKELHQALTRQHEGLARLAAVVQKDARDVAIIREVHAMAARGEAARRAR